MKKQSLAVLITALFASGAALAQSAGPNSEIRMSTDPARVAEVERRAAEIIANQQSDQQRMQTSGAGQGETRAGKSDKHKDYGQHKDEMKSSGGGQWSSGEAGAGSAGPAGVNSATSGSADVETSGSSDVGSTGNADRETSGSSDVETSGSSMTGGGAWGSSDSNSGAATWGNDAGSGASTGANAEGGLNVEGASSGNANDSGMDSESNISR